MFRANLAHEGPVCTFFFTLFSLFSDASFFLLPLCCVQLPPATVCPQIFASVFFPDSPLLAPAVQFESQSGAGRRCAHASAHLESATTAQTHIWPGLINPQLLPIKTRK